MISYKKALEVLKSNKINIKSEIILSKDSSNRICSHDIKSPNNYPAADNTAFDGFAINSKDTNKINQNNQDNCNFLVDYCIFYHFNYYTNLTNLF